MSSLFGGGDTTQRTRSSQQSGVNVDPQYQALLDSLLGTAQGVAGTPFTPYPGVPVAPFAPDTLAGFDAARAAGGVGSGLLDSASESALSLVDRAGRLPTEAEIESLMSPYIGNVIDVAQEGAREDYDVAMNRLASERALTGSFGGSRHGVQEGELGRGLGRTLAEIEYGGRQDAYDRALNAYNSLIGQGIGAVNTASGLSNTMQDQAYRGASALTNIGGAYQNQAQSALDFGLGEFQRQQQYPFDTTNFLANIAYGYPTNLFDQWSQGTSKTTQSTSSNPLGQILGLGLGLTQMGFNPLSALSSIPSFFGGGGSGGGTLGGFPVPTGFADGGYVEDSEERRRLFRRDQDYINLLRELSELEARTGLNVRSVPPSIRRSDPDLPRTEEEFLDRYRRRGERYQDGGYVEGYQEGGSVSNPMAWGMEQFNLANESGNTALAEELAAAIGLNYNGENQMDTAARESFFNAMRQGDTARYSAMPVTTTQNNTQPVQSTPAVQNPATNGPSALNPSVLAGFTPEQTLSTNPFIQQLYGSSPYAEKYYPTVYGPDAAPVPERPIEMPVNPQSGIQLDNPLLSLRDRISGYTRDRGRLRGDDDLRSIIRGNRRGGGQRNAPMGSRGIGQDTPFSNPFGRMDTVTSFKDGGYVKGYQDGGSIDEERYDGTYEPTYRSPEFTSALDFLFGGRGRYDSVPANRTPYRQSMWGPDPVQSITLEDLASGRFAPPLPSSTPEGQGLSLARPTVSGGSPNVLESLVRGLSTGAPSGDGGVGGGRAGVDPRAPENVVERNPVEALVRAAEEVGTPDPFPKEKQSPGFFERINNPLMHMAIAMMTAEDDFLGTVGQGLGAGIGQQQAIEAQREEEALRRAQEAEDLRRWEAMFGLRERELSGEEEYRRQRMELARRELEGGPARELQERLSELQENIITSDNPSEIAGNLDLLRRSLVQAYGDESIADAEFTRFVDALRSTNNPQVQAAIGTYPVPTFIDARN